MVIGFDLCSNGIVSLILSKMLLCCGLECVTWWGRLRELRVFGLEKKKLKGHLIAVLSCLKRGYREDRARLLSTLLSERTRGNGHKMLQGKF